MQKKLAVIALISIGLLTGLNVKADVKLPAIFGDNMMLQAAKDVPVWGTAAAGEKVTVIFGKQSVATQAGPDGKWQAKLALSTSNQPATLIVAGHNTITLTNVLVGSVWICSGQSNMEFGMRNAHNASEEIPKANDPQIRLFTVKKKIALEPQSDCVGHWVECNSNTVQNFSAVAYFFGRDVHQATGLPIGLIHTSWGGTIAQAWTSLSGLEKDPELADSVAVVKKKIANDATDTAEYPKLLAAYEAKMKDWNQQYGKAYQDELKAWDEEVKRARASGQTAPARPVPTPPQPVRLVAPDSNPNLPTVLFNGMIAPLIPFAIEGAIWYQGESNAGKPLLYRTLFPLMISDWREKWGEGNFPFLFVQLANFMARQDKPSESNWAGLREAQTMTLALPKTGMATIIDIGEAGNIHPKDKADVGHRLALAALKVAYGKDIVSSGPLYKGMTIEGARIHLSFQDVGAGLVIGAAPAIRLGTAPAKPAADLEGFAIAGVDQKWVWAKAEISNDTVVVWNDTVPKPVAVRYAWASNPECNLYNKEGLPASPFRTDDWPIQPAEAKHEK